MFSTQNLSFKDFATNKSELVSSLANLLPGGGDARAVQVAFLLAFAAFVIGLPLFDQSTAPRLERLRLPLLLALTAALFFWLPFDIRGFVYAMNTRYASLCAALAVCLPSAAFRFERVFQTLAAAAAVSFAIPLVSAFSAFDAEQAPLDRLAAQLPRKSKVMALNFDARSQNLKHPLFLHAAARMAKTCGGLSHFSFASTPHSPLKFKNESPPTYPSEWNPGQFDWSTQGVFYDAFLVHGAHPSQIPALQRPELVLAAEDSGWFLLRRAQ